jgi:hypothetical protein
MPDEIAPRAHVGGVSRDRAALKAARRRVRAMWRAALSSFRKYVDSNETDDATDGAPHDHD